MLCAQVMCFKRFCKRSGWDNVRALHRNTIECMSVAGSVCEFHLMGNGQDERTVVATLKECTPEASAEAERAAAEAGGEFEPANA